MNIKLKDITPAPWNTRGNITPESVQELAETIKAQGLINPITVWMDEDGNGWYCIAGNRRLAALHALGADEATCTEFKGTEHEAQMVTVTENLQREDVGIVEEAELVEKCLEDGMTTEDIAARTGRPASWVNRRKRLIALDAEWQAAADRFRPSELERIASYPPEVQKRVAKCCAPSTASWQSLVYLFEREMRDLAKAHFDTASCQACPNRTGADADLFGVGDDGLGKCMDCKCYQRKVDAAVYAEVEKRTKGADEVVTVKYAWELPREDESAAKRSKKYPCAYVFTASYESTGEIEVRWSVSQAAKEAVKEAKRREAAEADEANAAEVQRTRDIREAVNAVLEGVEGHEDAHARIVKCIEAQMYEPYSSLGKYLIGLVENDLDSWHRDDEIAAFLTIFPELTELAGVTAEDSAWFVSKHGEDEDAENENENE